MKVVRLLEKMEKHHEIVKGLGFIALGLVIIFDTLWVSKDHVHTALEKIPAFWSIFGLVSCVVIVVFSKWFGHLGIMKRENYYDD